MPTTNHPVWAYGHIHGDVPLGTDNIGVLRTPSELLADQHSSFLKFISIDDGRRFRNDEDAEDEDKDEDDDDDDDGAPAVRTSIEE